MGRFRDLMDSGDLPQEVERAARRRSAFEERVVSALCRRFQIRGSIADLRQDCVRVGGRAWLSLVWWSSQHPSFPFHLEARVIPRVHEVTAADWLQRLTRTEIFREWDDAFSQLPPDWDAKPFGLVFEWSELQTTVVMYNAPPNWDAVTDVGGMYRRLVRVGFFTVEPLVSFLAGLTWSPQS